MTQRVLGRLLRIAGHVALGSLGVAAITAVCFPLHPDLAIPAFLYLLLVVLQSAVAEFAASAIVSFVAVACLDYFFVPPILAWDINRPLDGMALLAYLATSLVITRFAARARNAARASESKRKALALLYEAACQLLSLEPEAAAGESTLRILREVFGLHAACLVDGTTAKAQLDGDSAHGLAERTRRACLEHRDYDDPSSKVFVRCLRVAGKVTGAVGFEGLGDAESTVGSLATLTAGTLDRARSYQAANEAAAATQAEILRSALLDAFAHEFKTPLATIITATEGMRQTGMLVPEQIELAEIVENEASRLSHLATRLLRMARLDREEVKPRLKHEDLAALIKRTADQLRQQAAQRIVTLDLSRERVEVLADSELLGLALIQLLDNALKYSSAEDTVCVRLEFGEGLACIRVTSAGIPIPAEECERVFERFYRGSGVAHVAPGSGLGLYFARKIVVAHGGSLELDRQPAASDGGTTFCLRLPVAHSEALHELQAS
jgi:two-component system, OmpR family, sensor histidine kinase KdpD